MECSGMGWDGMPWDGSPYFLLEAWVRTGGLEILKTVGRLCATLSFGLTLGPQTMVQEPLGS